MLTSKQRSHTTDPLQARRRLRSDDFNILRDRPAWVSRIDERHAHASAGRGISIGGNVEGIPITVSAKVRQHRPDLAT